MIHAVLGIALAVAVAALLWAERAQQHTGKWLLKPVASLLFVAIAVSLDAWESRYGVLILVGLALSLAGDVLLIPDSRGPFLTGLVSFLSAHILYAAAFVVAGVHWGWAGGVAAALALAAAAVMRWLWPHIPGPLRGPVVAYVVAISAMLALAVAAWIAGSTPLIAAGALLFYLSDLSVARDRFVAQGFVNRAWGLPAYYTGQALLAFSLGA